MSENKETNVTTYSGENQKENCPSAIPTESTDSKQDNVSETSIRDKEQIEHLLTKQESERKGFLSFFVFIFIVFAIILVFVDMTPEVIRVLCTVIPILGIIMIVVYLLLSRSNSEFYKKKILPIIIRQAIEDNGNLGGRINFDIGKFLKDSNVKEFNDSDLFSYCNNVSSEDIFSGQMNKTDFMFREISLGHQSGRTSSKVFKGLNIRIEFDDMIASRTLFNMVTPLFGKNEYNTFKTDDEKFNKLYKVYSNDSEGTSQMLTEEFKEKLIRLYQTAEELREHSTSDKIKILMNLNVLDIYIPCKVNLFEASFFTKMTLKKVEKDRRRIMSLFDTLEMFTTNVNYLKFEEQTAEGD